MDATQPESLAPCPECGGQRVSVPCSAHMGLMIGWTSSTHLRAIACTLCGYTALYAAEPQKLQKLLKRQEQ